jgi:hypothetical protein
MALHEQPQVAGHVPALEFSNGPPSGRGRIRRVVRLQPGSFWETGRLLRRVGNGPICSSCSRWAFAGIAGLPSCRGPWRRSLR